MSHFSRYIRPGAKELGFENSDDSLLVTAAQNPDGSIAVVILNQSPNLKTIHLPVGEYKGFQYKC